MKLKKIGCALTALVCTAALCGSLNVSAFEVEELNAVATTFNSCGGS